MGIIFGKGLQEDPLAEKLGNGKLMGGMGRPGVETYGPQVDIKFREQSALLSKIYIRNCAIGPMDSQEGCRLMLDTDLHKRRITMT